MQQYRKKQEIIDAEQFLGGATLLGEEIIEHQCDYRMCDLCGGDNQKHLVVSNTNIIIKQGNWLVRFPEGNRLSYYSNEAFERIFEPVSAPSVAGPWHIRTEQSGCIPETGDMSVDVKEVITDGKIEIETSDEGDLQPIVDALNASGCRFNSHHAAQLENHILGYEKESLQEQLKALQSEGGLQWVKASDILPEVGTPLSLKIDGIPKAGIWEEYQNAFMVDGYRFPPTLYFIEWLYESSPSTANTKID